MAQLLSVSLYTRAIRSGQIAATVKRLSDYRSARLVETGLLYHRERCQQDRRPLIAPAVAVQRQAQPRRAGSYPASLSPGRIPLLERRGLRPQNTAPTATGGRQMLCMELGDRDSNPNYLIQSQTFCRLNYPPLPSTGGLDKPGAEHRSTRLIILTPCQPCKYRLQPNPHRDSAQPCRIAITNRPPFRAARLLLLDDAQRLNASVPG